MESIKSAKNILILTPFFSPNIGGVETHLDDLVIKLAQLNYKVHVHTYSPITTPNVKWKKYQKIGKKITIRRYYWFGKQLFHVLEKYPLFDFIYLTPYLFLRTFFWMVFNSSKIDVIHAHGINASLIAWVLKIFFRKKIVTSIHAIYEINPSSITAKLTAAILNHSDEVLSLSQASYDELIRFKVKPQHLHLYRYWIQTSNFYTLNKKIIRQKLNLEDKFSVIFVGRLIKKKGIRLLVKLAQITPDINFIFIGTGPESVYLESQKKYQNIKFLGCIANNKLVNYYNAADIFCIPSLYEEGFGRVIMEAVACGLPVIGSNKGGIKEALNNSVAVLIEPNLKNLKTALQKLYTDHNFYNQLQINTKKFARNNFSEKNINLITKYY